jgi:hypothetical protein
LTKHRPKQPRPAPVNPFARHDNTLMHNVRGDTFCKTAFV